ncbi:serine protease [Erythrobacter sp. GH1-10]|uniref:serine protease n=1 Tax=Erythrobacter sp. GH1-10 TaxID=3349334 RepID=UPI003877C30B
MSRLLFLFALCLMALAPSRLAADPGDIDAASRGVARVVLVGMKDERPQFMGHGTGFAVTSTMLVTNAHVVEDAARRQNMLVVVIPSEGDGASRARVVAIDRANDLALLELVDELRLPPLVLRTNFVADDNEVVALGYPGVVDRALSGSIRDWVAAQPPVKTRGFVSGQRDLRGTASILHSADIAGGNSGGPLVDDCGRVLGVNRAVTLSRQGEGEFYFAISNRELMPFLRANDVEAATTDIECRSLADIERAEAERREAAQAQAAAARAEREAETEQLRDEIEEDVREERENMMALAAVLLLIAAAGGFFAAQARQRRSSGSRVYVFAGIAGVAIIGAGLAWITRPGNSEVEDRLAAALGGDSEGESAGNGPLAAGKLTCTLDLDRSRITSDPDRDVEFEWDADGCVNGRTQYGREGARWSRVFVPNEEAVVSINQIDSDAREYRIERYLIGRNGMALARDTRQSYDPPTCGAINAADRLGEMQADVLSQLPDQPNERLIYTCENR